MDKTSYYSPETCKQLEQLGCVASSGMWIRVHKKNRGDAMVVSTQSGEKPTDKETFDFYPAYSNADFTASPEAKENCIKLWAYGTDSDKTAMSVSAITLSDGTVMSLWKFKAHELLDIILSGGDGESFIKEALKKKLKEQE